MTNFLDSNQSAKDFFTKIRGWKFNIPFSIFEKVIDFFDQEKKLIESGELSYKELRELISEEFTGRHKQIIRAKINKNL